MSSLTTLARPYAKAAFNLAQESSTIGLSQWLDMLTLASQLAADESMTDVLENPLVSPEQSVELITGVAGDRFDEAFKRYLSVLGENRRLALLPEITALFGRLKQQAERRLRVKVIAAMPLEDAQASRLSQALAKRFDCEIELDSEIDESILGGAVIYAADQVIDGSLRGRLSKLANALSR